MQDRQTELIYHPRELLSLQGVERILCVAPHPDDEILGCGGLLAAAVDAGCSVHALILTCGQQGAAEPQAVQAADLAAERRQESVAAAAVIGMPEPTFLGFQDRALRYDAALVKAISDAIDQHRPQVLLLPSLSEPHPDHQATALAGLAAAVAAAAGLHSVLFYECGAPLHANAHFPIDAVAERKWRALQCFSSQLGVEDYEPHARAMATLRAFGLRPPCQQAESFFRVNLAAVREKGALAALPQWPWVRERLELANDPRQLPLISVLVRSMNRACLPEALASVALQTYPNVELVVVNASGLPHRPLDYLPPGLHWRIVPAPAAPDAPAAGPPGFPPGSADAAPAALGRAAAANLALAEAKGELALFLDDDDLLQPQHLERLVAALQSKPRAAGAYAGVRVETHDGAHVRDYDLPWSRQRLLGINYLPIHAVLFRMDRVRQQALRFDESLPVLEDWQFWVQLTDGADLVHCPGVSAVYRQGLGQSALGDVQHPHHWRTWHRHLLQQWTLRAPPDQLEETLAWHAVELDRTQADGAHRVSEYSVMEARLEQALALARQHESAHQSLQQRLQAFSQESLAALALKESALQAQAAQASRLLAEREAEAQRFAANAQRELDAAQAQLHALASEQAILLQAKEAELQRFASQAQMREAELEATRLRLQQELNLAQAELAARRAELAAVYTSRSWRWTAPLRRGTGPAGPHDA